MDFRIALATSRFFFVSSLPKLLASFLIFTVLTSRSLSQAEPRTLNSEALKISFDRVNTTLSKQNQTGGAESCHIENPNQCNPLVSGLIEYENRNTIYQLPSPMEACGSIGLQPLPSEIKTQKELKKRINPTLFKTFETCSGSLVTHFESKALYTLGVLDKALQVINSEIQFIDSFLGPEYESKNPLQQRSCEVTNLPQAAQQCRTSCAALNQDQQREWVQLTTYNESLVQDFLQREGNMSNPPLKLKDIQKLEESQAHNYNEVQKKALALKLVIAADTPWIFQDTYQRLRSRNIEIKKAISQQLLSNRFEWISKWKEAQTLQHCFTNPFTSSLCGSEKFLTYLQNYPPLPNLSSRQECLMRFSAEQIKTKEALDNARDSVTALAAAAASLRIGAQGAKRLALGFSGFSNAIGAQSSAQDLKKQCIDKNKLTDVSNSSCEAPKAELVPEAHQCRFSIVAASLGIAGIIPLVSYSNLLRMNLVLQIATYLKIQMFLLENSNCEDHGLLQGKGELGVNGSHQTYSPTLPPMKIWLREKQLIFVNTIQEF